MENMTENKKTKTIFQEIQHQITKGPERENRENKGEKTKKERKQCNFSEERNMSLQIGKAQPPGAKQNRWGKKNTPVLITVIFQNTRWKKTASFQR